MTTATHIPTKLMKAQGAQTAAQAINLGNTGAGVFNMLALTAGSGIPSTLSGGVQFVADATATNPEDTAIGARPALTGITWAFDVANGVVDWSFSNVVYAQNGSDDGLTRYFGIYYTGVGSGDTTYPLVAILDPGQLVSVVTGSATLQCPSGGLIQFTGGG